MNDYQEMLDTWMIATVVFIAGWLLGVGLGAIVMYESGVDNADQQEVSDE